MYSDPAYLLLVVVTLVLGVATQAKIRSSYKKWSKVYAACGLTGAQMARRMLDAYGLYDVAVGRIAGELTDNYNPNDRTLYLSQGVYDTPSVAAIGIACHEAGHAVQHAKGYSPIKVRMAIVPVVNVASNVWIIILIIGFMLANMNLVWLAIIMYVVVVAFHLITLPVEFNASSRAMEAIRAMAGMPEEQNAGARSVLTSAALTYVAAALSSLLQLIYFIGLANRRG